MVRRKTCFDCFPGSSFLSYSVYISNICNFSPLLNVKSILLGLWIGNPSRIEKSRHAMNRREGRMGRISSYNRAITIKKSRHRLERDHGLEPEVSASSVSLSRSRRNACFRRNKQEREREGCLRSSWSQKTTLDPSSPLRCSTAHNGGRIERSRGARNGRLAE